MNNSMRRTTLLICTATVSLTLAACGSETPSSAGGTPSSTATKSTTTSTAAAPTTTATTSPTAQAPAKGTKVDGAALATRVDAAMSKAKFVHVHMDDGTVENEAEMDLVMTAPGTYDVAMISDDDELRTIGGTVYLNDPVDGWIRVDRDSKSPFAQMIVATMKMATAQGPHDSAEVFRASQITSKGPEIVEGVPTTAYTATVPMTKMLDIQLKQAAAVGLGEDDPEFGRDIASAKKAAAGKSITYSFSVDGQDRMVRMVMDAGGMPALFGEGEDDAGDEPTMMIATYSKWGVPVKITAPPKSKSIDEALPDMPAETDMPTP